MASKVLTVLFNPVFMTRSERHSPTYESGFTRTCWPMAAASFISYLENVRFIYFFTLSIEQTLRDTDYLWKIDIVLKKFINSY